MNTIARCGLLALMLLAATTAAALEPRAQQEIESLLAALERSGCEFYRNGEWHAAAQARTHLEKKYAYLLEKGLIDRTEDFIERVATKSSISGEAYQVRCGDAAPVPSARWLEGLLARERTQRSK